jgi:O-antigen/teichoic acid export membrane protein
VSTISVEVPRSRSLLRSGLGVGAATTFASGANYASNVALGRALGPDDFADAALLVSALLLLSALALGFQLTVARAMASGHGHAALVRARHRAAITGTILAVVIALTSPLIAGVFHMDSAVPLVILAAGVPIFFQASVGRGAAQAQGAFGRLAASIGVEAFIRVAVVFALLAIGLGPTGVAIALTVSFAAAVVPCWPVVGSTRSDVVASQGNRVILATVLLLFAQVVIANSDVWIVAARLPADAGRYAAVALIGRLVFVTASSIVTVVFPSLVANGRAGDRLLWRAIGIMAAFGGSLTFVAFFLGERLVAGMMGSQYSGAGTLLWPYALATTCFVIANLFAISGVASGRTLMPAFLVGGAVTQVTVLLYGAGRGVAWIVWAQVAVMAVLVLTMTTTAAVTSMVRSRTALPHIRLTTSATLRAGA